MKIYDLSDKMMGWVKAKGLKPGARVPSSREFAEALGLGRMQVNRAMTDMVGRGLLYRQGNRYFLGAGTKNTQAHPPIDLFVEKWHQTRALADMAARWDLELRVHVTDEPEEVRKGLLDLQGEEIQTSGILIYGGQFAKELGDFQKRGIPVVVFSESSDSLDSVSPDTGRMAEIAVRKLIEAGHRELAFVSPPGFQAFPLTRSQAEAGYRQCCLDFNLTASAERMLHVDEGESALNNFWQMFEPGYPMVSALVCETPFIAHRLLKKIRREGLRVPGSLSVVALFEDDFSAMDVRKLCAVGINMDRLTRLALGVLLEKIEWKQMGKRHAPGLSSMRLEPEFFPGGSLGPPRSELGAASERMEAGPVARETWPTERKDRISEVRKINRHPFPNPGKGEFSPLDLSPWEQRRRNRHYHWMGGQPLKHLSSGPHTFHGVPCVIGEKSIVFRSRFAKTAEGKALPEVLWIPIGQKAREVYVLQAGGWLTHREVIARYQFELAQTVIDPVEVWSLGRSEPGESPPERSKVLISDWHSSGERFATERVRPVLITEKGDPLRYLRCLYLYRWINPHPEELLKAMKIHIMNPELRPTLAVLSVTLRLVED